MLHAGLDLSRKKLDVCLLSESGERVDQLAAPPDADALRALARRIDEVYRVPVCAVIESMTGARLVHDTLEQEGWDTRRVLAELVEGSKEDAELHPVGQGHGGLLSVAAVLPA